MSSPIRARSPNTPRTRRVQAAALLAVALLSAGLALYLSAPHALDDLLIVVLLFASLAAGRQAFSRLHGGLGLDERRRQHAREFMQRAIDAVPEPVFVKNRDGQLVMVNEAYCLQRKRSREDIMGKTARDLTRDGSFADFIQSEDERVLAGERIFKEESIPHPVTGEPLHQFVTKAASIDEDGNPVIVGTFFDISPLRDAEQKLREALVEQQNNGAFLQFVFDAVPIPLFVKDTDLRYVMTNTALLRFEGISREQVIGKRASDLIDAPTAAAVEAEEQRMLQGEDGMTVQSERIATVRDGSAHHTVLHKVIGRDASGKRIFIGALTDITRLRHAEARWQFALEGAGDGLWDWDIARDSTYYSPRWKAMQGFAEDDISTSPDERLRRIHPDDMEAVQAALDVHLSGRVPIYICELRQRNKDGEYVWMLDRGQVVERDAEGRPLRMIGIYTDITSRKIAEEELLRHRDQLRDMVEEQTHDLVVAKESAEHANAAKSRFLANMSHELRTPMHAVLSFAKLGEEKAVQATPEKLQGYFQRIRESGDRLLNLLNDLLDLSKLEAGRMVLHMQRTDLAKIAGEALREFEASLIARRLRGELLANESETRLIADSVRLGQVVRNLLSNAIKFSPEGGRITLSIAPVTQDDGHDPALELELRVADEGVGIPPGELESVFDIFVQSSTTRSDAGGTGLGLPICREIVHAHGGQIFARNRERGGSEFIVRIPTHPHPTPPQ